MELGLHTQILQIDWHSFQTNAVILLSADQLAVPDDHQESHFPRYLLYKKVFL